MAETGRQLTVEVTEEMLRAGADALVLDACSDDAEVARLVLLAALEAGGYAIREAAEVN